MPFIAQQQFCDMLKVSKKQLRVILKNHEYPVYEVKRCGNLVYDYKDAVEFTKVYNIERAEKNAARGWKRWMKTMGRKSVKND